MADSFLGNWILKLNSIRDRMSLRQQISLATAGLCFLSIMVAAIVASTIARQAAIEETRQDLVLIGQSMAQTLDQDMFNRFREVRNIAELELLRSVWKRNPDAIRDVLEQLQQSLPVYAWVGFAAPDGTVIAATQTMLEGSRSLNALGLSMGSQAQRLRMSIKPNCSTNCSARLRTKNRSDLLMSPCRFGTNTELLQVSLVRI
jgi:predicted RNA-binding Zn ribbon-like protein